MSLDKYSFMIGKIDQVAKSYQPGDRVFDRYNNLVSRITSIEGRRVHMVTEDGLVWNCDDHILAMTTRKLHADMKRTVRSRITRSFKRFMDFIRKPKERK